LTTRSYASIIRRLERAVESLPDCRLTPIGTVVHGTRAYPLFQVTLTVGTPRHAEGSRARMPRRPMRVCVGAGIHGDEPAGVEAVLEWLEALPADRRRLPAADLTIFPCLNPSGYVHNRRTNDDGVDLNRQYKNPRPPVEIDVVRRVLTGRRFDLSVEFHEDVDSAGFYLYELTEGVPPIGERLIADAARTLPINHSHEIEGMNARRGIIQRDRRTIRHRRRLWPHAIYLFQLGTPRCLTLETPISVPLRRRSAVHARLLTLAMRLCTLFIAGTGFSSRSTPTRSDPAAR
jgi:protein MpaA